MIRAYKITVAALLAAALLLLTACGTDNNRLLGEYLAPYEEKASAYLLSDEEFLDTYGTDCALDTAGFSFSYKDPKKYSGIALSPKIPASAEEFAKEVESLAVKYYLPDNRSCTVLFGQTPEGVLEITGWEYADEE